MAGMYDPPRADVGPPRVQGAPPEGVNLQYAKFGVRAAARIIDTIAGFVVGAVGGALGGALVGVLQATGSLDAGAVGRLGGLSIGSFVLSSLGNLAYHAASEGMGGASLGKLLTGLRVLRQDGAPATIGAGLIRSLAYYIDAFFFGLVAYSVMSKSPAQQRLGDQWGKTVVVRNASVPPSSARSPAGGLVVGVIVWAACIALGTVLKGL
jgi:uncharacterized RDD family membrane protein YckC